MKDSNIKQKKIFVDDSLEEIWCYNYDSQQRLVEIISKKPNGDECVLESFTYKNNYKEHIIYEEGRASSMQQYYYFPSGIEKLCESFDKNGDLDGKWEYKEDGRPILESFVIGDVYTGELKTHVHQYIYSLCGCCSVELFYIDNQLYSIDYTNISRNQKYFMHWICQDDEIILNRWEKSELDAEGREVRNELFNFDPQDQEWIVETTEYEKKDNDIGAAEIACTHIIGGYLNSDGTKRKNFVNRYEYHHFQKIPNLPEKIKIKTEYLNRKKEIVDEVIFSEVEIDKGEGLIQWKENAPGLKVIVRLYRASGLIFKKTHISENRATRTEEYIYEHIRVFSP